MDYSSILAIVFLLFGSYRIYCILASIDFAATNIPLPNFEASFSEYEQKIEIEPSKKQTVTIMVTNSGYDVGEMVDISIFFPPNFKVAESQDYEKYVQPKGDPQLSSYTGLFFELDCIHVDTSIVFDIRVTSPKEPGYYRIPIYM